jgi:hypothetical protein
VIEAQLARREPLAAILAVISVAGKNVATIEPHTLLRHAVVMQQSQDTRNLNFEVDASHPILVRFLVLRVKLANLAPRFKVVIRPLVALDMNYFGQPAEKKNECPAHVDHVDRYVLTVEQQNAGA